MSMQSSNKHHAHEMMNNCPPVNIANKSESKKFKADEVSELNQ